jgi:hypothetical protein
MKVVPEENWEFYSYQTDNGPVVVGFNAGASKIDQAALPFCARIIIPIKEPDQHGGPNEKEAKFLWALEDSLTEQLSAHSVPCQLLGRLTYEGVRELVFQLHDWETFRPPVGQWMQQHEDLDINASEHEDWEFFFASVWPTRESWLYILDRRVVDNLVRSGSNPKKLHSLEFVFRGPAEARDQLRAILLNRGYAPVQSKSPAEILVMAKSMALDLAEINDASLSHDEECKRLGLEYDGWGCLVVK